MKQQLIFTGEYYLKTFLKLSKMNYKLTVISETGITFDYLLLNGAIENTNNVSEVASIFILNNPNPRSWIMERIRNGSFTIEAGNFLKRYDKVKMNWVIE